MKGSEERLTNGTGGVQQPVTSDASIQPQKRQHAAGFWQLLVILSVMNLIDRFLIDGYWVGHTNAWMIPGTEDLKPYITAKDKQKKWLFGTVGMAVIAAVLARIMMFLMES